MRGCGCGARARRGRRSSARRGGSPASDAIRPRGVATWPAKTIRPPYVAIERHAEQTNYKPATNPQVEEPPISGHSRESPRRRDERHSSPCSGTRHNEPCDDDPHKRPGICTARGFSAKTPRGYRGQRSSAGGSRGNSTYGLSRYQYATVATSSWRSNIPRWHTPICWSVTRISRSK